MSMIHFLLAAAYPPLHLGNSFLRYVGAKSDARLRVLIYHAIAPQEKNRFAAQLRWLARVWTFVSPHRFAAMMCGDEPVKGANLLLTFDDGFISNRVVVDDILNPMGIQALFFVVSTFVDLDEGDDYRAFIATHIRPGLPPETIPAHCRNLSWDDLSYLLEKGHTVGAHSRTHSRLSALQQAGDLEVEIIDSANVLEGNLGVKIEHFAYPFGDLSSISPSTLAVARQRFRFIHTGLRGDNANGAPSWALRRDAISPANSLGLIGALLEGGADIRYVRDLVRYESWGYAAK